MPIALWFFVVKQHIRCACAKYSVHLGMALSISTMLMLKNLITSNSKLTNTERAQITAEHVR